MNDAGSVFYFEVAYEYSLWETICYICFFRAVDSAILYFLLLYTSIVVGIFKEFPTSC